MNNPARRVDDAPASPGWGTIRSRLFRKYAALFVAVVCFALLANGMFEIWFSYQERKASLVADLHARAEAATEKIGQFIDEIKTELGWMTLLPRSGQDASEQRYFDAMRLLRLVPAITELTQVDGAGREQLHVSRLVTDAVDSKRDLSQTQAFKQAMAHGIWYGPVYFRRESEPHMTIATAGTLRDSGASIAEVNLTFIWDVVSKIKVGEHGSAYVIDAQGRLIAHPEINLVLRHTELSQLAQVRAARAGASDGADREVRIAKDLRGREVLTAYAPVAPLGWLLFAELPTGEAFAPLYQAVLRSAALLVAAFGAAALAALLLARRMVAPIRMMRERAARIGAGDLGQRIAVSTGDELEELGDQFNRMAAQLQESYATLEHKVEERTHQLEVANVAKSRFIAAASHDLRQPLHALGLLAAQLRSSVDPVERKKIVERINAAIAEMNELFAALLDVSKLDAGVLTPNVAEFPIAQLLRSMETTFAGAARQKGLSLRFVPSTAWVRSDPILLTRIMLNLLSNAVRYTLSGGIIVGCRRRAETLRIEVWDSGPGIPEDQRENIFGEFYQLGDSETDRRSGLGLGLAIVDRLCRLLGHLVELTSALGKGSRFAVVVPLAATHPESLAPAPRHAGAAARGEVVVVIDDAILVLEAMAGLLRHWGFSVVTAESCEAALARLAEQNRRPDLVISDYHLTGGSGIEAIERMRGVFGTPIPAFLISGDTSPQRLRDARAKGYYLLHKPVEPMRLRAVVANLLKNESDASTKSSAPDERIAAGG
jgi:signal transduction histidine kinase/CheY-like chemotaxis protein